jgi:GxxExxY protein
MSGEQATAGYRIDCLAEDLVFVELTAVEKMLPLYEAQLLSYLKLIKKSLGLFMNLNEVRLKTA